MIRRTYLPLFLACFFGYATSPSYASDTISCGNFEGCVEGSSDVTNILLQMQAEIAALQASNAELKALLAGVSRGVDPNTSQDTLTFANMNVQVVSGSGATDGEITGTGNLIIGYNELLGDGDERTGSHMLVVGKANNYSSFGGMVVGLLNETANFYASVSGGRNNTASGAVSSVSGGIGNTTSGDVSSVSGGRNNTASGYSSSVGGGQNNGASEEYSYSPDLSSAVTANTSAITTNTNAINAIPDYSALLAGVSRGVDPNTSQDTLTFTNMNVQVVSGSGATNGTLTGTGNLIIGYNELHGSEDDRIGSHMLVFGSKNNYSSYGGMVGGFTNTASGNYSSVSGGTGNTASGTYSSVSGGAGNTASGAFSSVSGGQSNTASHSNSSISGGISNEASGTYSSVSGGAGNTASGTHSSVSGGNTKTASTQDCIVGDNGVDC